MMVVHKKSVQGKVKRSLREKQVGFLCVFWTGMLDD